MHRRTHRRWHSLAWVTLWNLMLWAAVGMPMTGGSAWAMADTSCASGTESCCCQSSIDECAMATQGCAAHGESHDEAPADPTDTRYCCCFCGIPVAVLPVATAMASLPLERAVPLTLLDQPGLRVPAAIFHPPQF